MKKKIKELLKNPDLRTQGIQTLSLLFLAFIVAFLMNFSWGEFPADIEVGNIAHQDIRADKNYEIIDNEATEALKRETVAAMLPVFDWDEDVSDQRIIENPEDLVPWKDKGILIRRVKYPDQPTVVFKDFDSVLSLEEARNRTKRSGLKLEIKPNLFFNETETKFQTDRALADVKPVILKIQAGESIIRGGDHFEARHIKAIDGIRKEKNKHFGRLRLLGTFLFVSLLLLVFFFVLRRSAKKVKLQPKDYVFLGVLLILTTVLERMFVFICEAMRGLLPLEIPLSSFYGLIPVVFGTLMVRMVLPFPIALLFAPVSAVLAGFFLQGSLNHTLYYLVGCSLGIPLMVRVRTRGQILKVGVQLGVINAVTILTLDMVSVTSLSGVVSLEDSGIRVAFAFLGGIFNSVLVLILMPVFESVFNYLTPIKLLEYGSLNHPILREMIVRAPGTYHHSHMVGTLAEAACEAIGADSLFARVSSYFHDIGKMKKSPYFIENQSVAGTEDKHASLAPSMSALIICSHVKDGIELAREYKLPQKIIDIIPQHQGTKLISYFYNKAKEAENSDLHVVSEQDYRYPGPKPQTREAGIILLADTIEAATRALKDRSPARIEEVVRNMINKNFIDGQLDECELTLKDLHLIATTFVRILMGLYHQRVEYPKDQQEKKAQELSEETNVDKYSQPKLLSSDSLKKSAKSP